MSGRKAEYVDQGDRAALFRRAQTEGQLGLVPGGRPEVHQLQQPSEGSDGTVRLSRVNQTLLLYGGFSRSQGTDRGRSQGLCLDAVSAAGSWWEPVSE